MDITEYGQKLAKATEDSTALANAVGTKTGADAHAAACGTDAGLNVILTGKDFNDKGIRKTAKSVAGAFFTMKAVAGLERAWHVDSSGKRKLLISRSAL